MAKATTPNGAPDAAPVPPWERSRKAKAQARTPLSQEAVVEAALRILETDGYDGLSMRRVAAELNTGAASLYAHVANKDELIKLVIDRVFGGADIPEADPDRWVEQVREMMRGTRQLLQAHPGIARAMLGQVPFGPSGLRIVEGFMAILRAGDLPDQAAAWAGDVISLYTVASVFEEDIRFAPHGDSSQEDIQVWADQMKDYIRSLPVSTFPNLVALADPMFESGGPDGRFEFGLDLMLRGLASLSRRNPS